MMIIIIIMSKPIDAIFVVVFQVSPMPVVTFQDTNSMTLAIYIVSLVHYLWVLNTVHFLGAGWIISAKVCMTFSHKMAVANFLLKSLSAAQIL